MVLWWMMYGYVLWRWRPRTGSSELLETAGDWAGGGQQAPRVSILIPARNEGACLPEVLEALTQEPLLNTDRPIVPKVRIAALYEVAVLGTAQR